MTLISVLNIVYFTFNIFRLEDPDLTPRMILRGLHTVRHLAPATDYSFSMRAHNAAGWSPLGGIVQMRTLPDVPGIPTQVQTTGNTATAVSLRFTSPIDYGEPIDWYEVAFRYYEPPENDLIALAVLEETDVAYRAEVGVWTLNSKKITNSSEFCHITNLPPASWHDFRIRAHNAVGYSEWSAASDKVRTDDAPYLVTKDPR